MRRSRYVVSCQVFGKMQVSKKKADKDKAGHIKMLARMFPGLRIAHVDEINGEFFSVLSKNAGDGTDNMVEEYRIKVRCQTPSASFSCSQTRLLHILSLYICICGQVVALLAAPLLVLVLMLLLLMLLLLMLLLLVPLLARMRGGSW